LYSSLSIDGGTVRRRKFINFDLINVSSKIKPFTFIVYDTVFSDSGAYFEIISYVIFIIQNTGEFFVYLFQSLPKEETISVTNTLIDTQTMIYLNRFILYKRRGKRIDS